MKRLLAVFALVLLSAAGSYAQNGMIALPPVLINAQGQPLAGVNVAVCSSLTTSVAAVTNNIATLTVSSTTGFTVGMTLNVSGFTGADTYFNVSSPIISLTATTLSYALTHANASASSNGSVYQTGNSSTPCAPLATLYTDHSTTTVTANPFTSTGLGNVLGWAPPAQYEIQSYGTGVTTTVQQVAIACVPNSGGTPGCTVVTNQANNFTALQEFSLGISADGTHTETIPSTTSTLLDVATAQSPTNKDLTTAGNGNTVTLLNSQGALSAIVGNSGDQTMYTYAVPANKIGSGKGFELLAVFQHTTGTASVTYKVKLGGQFMGAGLALTDSGVTYLHVWVMNNSGVQNAQNAYGYYVDGAATPASSNFATGALAQDMTQAQTLTVSFNVANTDQVTPRGFLVELKQ